MSKIVRMTSEDPISPESIERIKRLVSRPDREINLADIPETRFDLELAAKRRREGWRPGTVRQKKAS